MSPTRTLVLTNDDGVDEPGLRALGRACEDLGMIRVVAPASARSSCGHSVTTSRALRLAARADGVVAVDGTPADCVRLALHHLVPEPSWVLSGINAGGNLGVDIHLSGTVAAAREAALHGVPAVALSRYLARGKVVDWDQAARWARRVLEFVLNEPHQPGTFWNVNFPHRDPGEPEPEILLRPPDPSPLPLAFLLDGESAHYQGDYHSRPRLPGHDIEACFAGHIAVSRIRVTT